MLQHTSTQPGSQERRSKVGPSEPPASPLRQRKRSNAGPSHSPVISNPSTPITQVRKPENSGNLRDLHKRAGPSDSPQGTPSIPSTQVLNLSVLVAPPPISSDKNADVDSLKRKLESTEQYGNENDDGNREVRKKNKVVHDDKHAKAVKDSKAVKEAVKEVQVEEETGSHNGKEDHEVRKKDRMVDDRTKDAKELKEAVKEIVTEDEDSKLIELGAEKSSRALMHESVKALKEAKDRGLYDEYTSPDRVIRVPRSSWLMKPKKKPEEKKLSTEDKDTGALKRTLSELIVLKPMKKKHFEERTSDEPQESLRRTLSEAVKCRVQEHRKRSELAASVKANLEESFKDRRLDELSAQVASYSEKMGVQIRKAEVQDELYELQKSKVAAQSQEICKLKQKLDAHKRTTEAVKVEQVKLKKELEDAKEELEALKNLVGRMLVESSLKNVR